MRGEKLCLGLGAKGLKLRFEAEEVCRQVYILVEIDLKRCARGGRRCMGGRGGSGYCIQEIRTFEEVRQVLFAVVVC